MRDKHQALAYHMMYSMNSWSCLWAVLGILFTGEFPQMLAFLQTYPYVIPRILLLSITGAIGQVKPLFSTDYWRMSHVFRLELHILDDRMVWSVDLCNIHHHTKVFHYSLFCCDIWQCNDRAADVWNSSCFSRSLSRTDPWKEETLISRKSFRFVFVRVIISNKDGKISAATDWRVTARSLDEQARHFSERLLSKLARKERKRERKKRPTR